MPPGIPLLFAAAAVAAPPATIVSYEVTLRGDAPSELAEQVRLRLRVDDPAVARAAGLPLPAELNGAIPTPGGPAVSDGRWIPPEGARAGAVFDFAVARSIEPGTRAGEFDAATSLPTECAAFEIDLPPSVPLAVWSDARSEQAVERSRRVSIRWRGLDPNPEARLVWTTWPNWTTAGEALTSAVRAKLDGRLQLGGDFAGDIDGLGLAGLVERVREQIRLDPGPSSWATARRAADIVRSGHGTAAERGVVLLALFALTGFDAVPAGFEPPTFDAHALVSDAIPLTLPAPGLLEQPLVVVRRDGEIVWIDPASEYTAVPAPPVSLDGATVWVPGGVPFVWTPPADHQRTVHVSTAITLDATGAATFRATIDASTAAEEILRDRLAGLDDLALSGLFHQLLGAARPAIDRVQVGASGLTRPGDRLTLTVGGYEAAALARVSYGLRGSIAPTLAPALAEWLPAGIAIHETAAITYPPAVAFGGVGAPASALDHAGGIERTVRRDPLRAVLETEVLRTGFDPGGFFRGQAAIGVDLALMGGASGAIRRLHTADDLPPADRAALETVVWLKNDRRKSAAKTLRAAWPAVGFEPLVAAIHRYAEEDDPRPWQVLAEQPGLGDDRKLELAGALARHGGADAAVALARALLDSPDPDVAIGSRLLLLELSPSLGIGLDRREILAEAAARGADPRVAALRAEAELDAGNVDAARQVLAGAEDTPRGALVAARIDAVSGVPRDVVVGRVEAALARERDPELLLAAAAACAAARADRAAVDHVLAAARLAPDDPRVWSALTQAALAAADLPLAASGARRASDRMPADRASAEQWAALALARADRAQVDAARARAGLGAYDGSWPPSLAVRLAAVPDGPLAVLEHAEAAVLVDADALARRASLRLDAGRLDAAAMDGLALAARHQRVDGWAYGFAATAGRHYWSLAQEGLQIAVPQDPTARAVRMEYRLVSGAGDPREDAQALADDPRARALLAATKTRPTVASSTVVHHPPPLLAGYLPVPWLASGPDQLGWAHAAGGTAVIWTATDRDELPEPLRSMYPAAPQVLAALRDGGRLERLTGTTVPLYVATAATGNAERLWAVAFTAEGARRALDGALRH